jgi:hypothetical protein
MKKSLPQIQYSRLQALYIKLSTRLNKQFTTGRFSALSKVQQTKLLQRIERIKAQLHRLSLGLKLSGTALALGTVLYSSNAQAQFATAGSEFLVNTYTTNGQETSTVAMDSDGDFVVVWQSNVGQDGSGAGVYAQRYNSSGVAQGSEFKVNSYTTAYQSSPSVAMDSDGDFMVVWRSSGQDGSGYGVYGQRYNASGLAQGSEFSVNSYTTLNQQNSSVAMDSDGDFVVVWESTIQDGSNYGVYGQRYNASGVAQGSEFQVNTYTTAAQSNPSVSMDNDGDFVVTWQSAGQDGSGAGIYGQRYNASGVAQGSEFKVNTYTTSDQRFSSVAMDSDGDFVVVWESYGQDGSFYGVYGQRYNAAGVVQGSEFLVNTETSDRQRNSSIAIDSDGDFVVTWQSNGQDGSNDGIYGQRYNGSGVAQGSEFMVNSYTTSNQQFPSVAMDSDGDFVVTWQSFGQDGYGYGVYAQRYTGGFTTSTQAAQALSAFVLYPNPATDQVSFNLEGEVRVKIMDLSGQVVKEANVENQGFNIAGLKAGVYMVELTKNEENVVKKLVVE